MKRELIDKEDIIVRLMQEIDGIGPYGYTTAEEAAYANGQQAGYEMAIEIIRMMSSIDFNAELPKS